MSEDRRKSHGATVPPLAIRLRTCGQQIKPIELRSRPTRIIGERFYICAGQFCAVISNFPATQVTTSCVRSVNPILTESCDKAKSFSFYQ